MGPGTLEVKVGGLKHLVGEEKPESKDRLGKDIQDGVGNDLGVNRSAVSTLGESPDAVRMLVDAKRRSRTDKGSGTYIGYPVQMIRVKPAIELNKVAVFESRDMAFRRPATPSW